MYCAKLRNHLCHMLEHPLTRTGQSGHPLIQPRVPDSELNLGDRVEGLANLENRLENSEQWSEPPRTLRTDYLRAYFVAIPVCRLRRKLKLLIGTRNDNLGCSNLRRALRDYRSEAATGRHRGRASNFRCAHRAGTHPVSLLPLRDVSKT
jgi:hypothetical protein